MLWARKGKVSLGVGDIIVYQAPDESCWPVRQRDGETKCNGGEGNAPIGLTCQVTDVKKPPLAVRR